VLETPNAIRGNAILDFLQGFNTCMEKKKNDPLSLRQFEMHYQSKKAPRQTISVPKTMWGVKQGKFAGVLNKRLLKSSQPLPEKILYDFKVVKDRLGHFYLCIPQPLNIVQRHVKIFDSRLLSCQGNNQALHHQQQQQEKTADTPRGRVIALDPGVRTFQTGYDSQGQIIEFCPGDIKVIASHCLWLDRLQ